jgi:hypothetical protein
MDTKTLVVGQDVYIESGVYGCKGKVVKVTPSGVNVQTDKVGLLRFDNEGKTCDGNGTFECGPWCIDDMPFTERTALLEQQYRKFKEKELKE